MEHLQHNTYRFNFRLEQIIIGRRAEVNMSPHAVVDGLPDVTIRGEDNGNDDEVLCVVCYEPLRNGETAKQLTCTHGLLVKSIVTYAEMSQLLVDDHPVLLCFIHSFIYVQFRASTY